MDDKSKIQITSNLILSDSVLLWRGEVDKEVLYSSLYWLIACFSLWLVPFTSSL
jgi:hypothetical protein